MGRILKKAEDKKQTLQEQKIKRRCCDAKHKEQQSEAKMNY
jgi:hypothetical protein